MYYFSAGHLFLLFRVDLQGLEPVGSLVWRILYSLVLTVLYIIVPKALGRIF